MTAESQGGRVPRVTATGPGSNAEAAGVADRIARGLEQGARSMAAGPGATGTDRIPQLWLRLSAGAGEAESARAFEQTRLGRGRRR